MKCIYNGYNRRYNVFYGYSNYNFYLWLHQTINHWENNCIKEISVQIMGNNWFMQIPTIAYHNWQIIAKQSYRNIF